MQNRDVILGVLFKNDRNGYEINEIFKTIFSHFYDATYGMIYPTLKKLEKEGLVSKRKVVQEGRPNKNVYSITAEGKKTFKESLLSKVSPEMRKSDFLMRMYFGEYLQSTEVIKILEEEVEAKGMLVKQLQENLKNWEHMSLTQEISFKVGIQQYRDEINILEEYIKKYQKTEK
ncbi:helix-turn-helix transcriptional regulator [Pediococcus stilesii]|uniref:Helix-turn-helix transcriptional regulator n=1 Tax=Pediococcus stilesii TaxID=331679 RepID=A0A5R9BWQ6_9LACO|nr:PadR family transcriptional regulator [Pediococcus stilesii]TLQ04312.1 helix-turn-helix transcriptional regulator [Pediococcus stilesii]